MLSDEERIAGEEETALAIPSYSGTSVGGEMPSAASPQPLAEVFARRPVILLWRGAGGKRLTFEEASVAAGVGLQPIADLSLSVRTAMQQPTCLAIFADRIDETLRATIADLSVRTMQRLPILVVLEQGGSDDAVDLMQDGTYSVLIQPLALDRTRGQIERAVRRSVADFDQLSRTMQLRERFEKLTEKERAVLKLVQQGQSNRQIAATLDISVRAVEDRRSRAMKRLEASSLVELVQFLQQIDS